MNLVQQKVTKVITSTFGTPLKPGSFRKKFFFFFVVVVVVQISRLLECCETPAKRQIMTGQPTLSQTTIPPLLETKGKKRLLVRENQLVNKPIGTKHFMPQLLVFFLDASGAEAVEPQPKRWACFSGLEMTIKDFPYEKVR